MGTQRSHSELDALFADNVTRQITPAYLRDFTETVSCTNGSFYITTPAATTIGTIGTFVKAAGTTTQVNTHRVTTPVNNRLTYTGTAQVHAHIVANMSIQCSANNQSLAIAVAKNGVILDHSIMEHFLNNNTDIKAITVHADCTMDPGDYLEIWITNNTSTASVTMKRAYLFFMGMLCD